MTKSTFFVEEDKILATLFDEGLDNLHLFKPGSEPIYSERLLTLLADDCHHLITVHDHYYLKDEYGLKGIHLNDATAPLPNGYRGNVSRTCHTLDELKEAKQHASYVFLQSVFDSQSNKQEKQAFSFDELKEAAHRGLIDKKVYALGGMNLDTIRIARDLGFGGVVICGDLWNRFNIHNELNYKELIVHFNKLRKAVG